MLLSALKAHGHNLTAIVSMADDGGSTGVLRDELGALPAGDIRQCLVALSESPKLRDLFSYRFDQGTFSGHSFGNIFLSTLEKMTGSFSEAVETASEVLRVDGRVLPATLDNVRLKMTWDDESVVLSGEHQIDADYFAHDPRTARLSLEPSAAPNPEAINAIQSADLVLVAPGDIYTSLGPLLVIEGIGEALQQTNATVAYVCNLVTKEGQTDGFNVEDHVSEIERFAGSACIDAVIYNEEQPSGELAERYKQEGAYIVQIGNSEEEHHYSLIAGNFIGQLAEPSARDTIPVTRSYIRHDGERLAAEVLKLV